MRFRENRETLRLLVVLTIMTIMTVLTIMAVLTIMRNMAIRQFRGVFSIRVFSRPRKSTLQETTTDNKYVVGPLPAGGGCPVRLRQSYEPSPV